MPKKLDYLEEMRQKAKNITKEEAQAMLRRVMGPPHRELKDKEYDHIWTLLQLLEPVKESNNQRTWTSEYLLNGKRYDVTYGFGDKPIIEEYGEI